MPTNVTIYHAGFGGDKNKSVYSYQEKKLENDKEICERAFNMFNAPLEYLQEDDDFFIGTDYRSKRLRSLSVGDIVEVNNTKWICRPVGWQLLMEYDEEFPKGDIYSRKYTNEPGVSRTIG
jgi:hypothetical protein